jgi:hypothetical protein
MKKIILILVIVTLVCLLTACGNFQHYYDEDYYKVNYALVNIKGEWVEVEVKSWSRTKSNEMVGIVLNDGTVLMTSAENCILYNGTLPKTETFDIRDDHAPMNDFEQHIIDYASFEVDKESEGATMKLIYSEYIGFAECNMHTYAIVFADGSKYIARAREDEEGLWCSVGKL